jgi:two-component system response regulator MprA
MNGADERPTLLVIDDEPSWRTLYRLEFEDRFNVVEAADGRDGLEKLQRVRPDLVILDVSMPRMDGIGFLRWLREGGVTVPVIVCTAVGLEAQTLARAGVWVVAKSPDLTELWRAVQTLTPAA